MEAKPVLDITDLHVFRGASHILQGVSLQLGRTPLALVGRNGMGKTTLCEALMGLLPVREGAIRLGDQEIAGRRPFRVAQAGIGYVPQGRRVFRSLSVHEHLRMVARPKAAEAAWTIERVYETFPRLAERRRNGGAQLSGGEQQMLAVARALLLNPVLLVMDEPTEGLAPVIIQQIGRTVHELKKAGFTILLVEQNFRWASTLADRFYVMEHGKIIDAFAAADLSANMDKLHDYLGV
jgi:branched-chain amino acid transport system ATP-binding protein